MTKLISQSMKDEYVRLLQSKGRDEARRMIFARLQMKHNRKWMNEHSKEIEKELEEK
jgi:hypothetical protein